MELTKIFRDGNTQTIKLPKDCMFDGDEVFIERVGNRVILTPVDAWAGVRRGLEMFTDDFLADGIEDLPPQERDI